MYKYFIIILITLGSLFSMETVAIIDLEPFGMSTNDAKALTQRLISQMIQIGKYTIVERSEMKRLLDEHWNSKNAVSINDWVSYYIIEDNEDLLERTREIYGNLIFINYNLYKIFHLLGDEAKSEKFINSSYDEIMDIASKLKKGDKQRFLNDNILIANIISDWNMFTH